MNKEAINTLSLSEIENDLTQNIQWTVRSRIWMGTLLFAFAICLYFYVQQLIYGLGVTGLHDYASWGIYISNFVFFVATSLVGMLISSVFGLANVKWIKPIARIAEIIAVSFAMVAGLVIITDMGRPDRLLSIFVYGRVQSPIVWDIAVVTTYVFISLLLLYVPLIPDFAMISEKKKGLPKLQIRIYKALSLGWADKPEQFKVIKRLIQTLLVIIIPVALAIHTVTSWLFALTLRPGWDSSIFGPYFVSGAFVAGSAALIMALYFYRRHYHLENYITEEHFNSMGKILVLVSLIYLYFNLNEILVPGFKPGTAAGAHINELLSGTESTLYWAVQIFGLAIPLILLLIPRMRKPFPVTVLSLMVFVGAWFKRYLIVVPSQLEPYLPIQNVPESFHHYSPTTAEVAITAGSFILVLIIMTVLSKVIPLIPIWEVKEELK